MKKLIIISISSAVALTTIFLIVFKMDDPRSDGKLIFFSRAEKKYEYSHTGMLPKFVLYIDVLQYPKDNTEITDLYNYSWGCKFVGVKY